MTEDEHLLVILMEECAEVAQNISKALRFGLDDKLPGSIETNMEKIEYEFIDLTAVHDMLLTRKILIGPGNAHELYNNKINKVEHYIDYAKEKGTITIQADD